METAYRVNRFPPPCPICQGTWCRRQPPCSRRGRGITLGYRIKLCGPRNQFALKYTDYFINVEAGLVLITPTVILPYQQNYGSGSTNIKLGSLSFCLDKFIITPPFYREQGHRHLHTSWDNLYPTSSTRTMFRQSLGAGAQTLVMLHLVSVGTN